MYYEIWSDNEELQKRFHALYDATIVHTMENHYYPTMLYLFIFRNRSTPYGITRIERYCEELGYNISQTQKKLKKAYKKDTSILLRELHDHKNGINKKHINTMSGDII